MPQPILNGALASTTGMSLAQRAASLPNLEDDVTSIRNLNDVGVGLLIALAVLAYWYRRVL